MADGAIMRGWVPEAYCDDETSAGATRHAGRLAAAR